MSSSEIKIITLGESEVGKSSFIIKYVEGQFSSNYCYPRWYSDKGDMRIWKPEALNLNFVILISGLSS